MLDYVLQYVDLPIS